MLEFFEFSDSLNEIWEQINQNVFKNELKPLSAMGWHNNAENDDHGHFGIYSHTTNAMSFSNRFHILEEELQACKNIGLDPVLSRDDKVEQLSAYAPFLDIAYGLVAHEMAHQAACQFSVPFYEHGSEFIKWANLIARESDLPAATEENAAFWPPQIIILIDELGL